MILNIYNNTSLLIKTNHMNPQDSSTFDAEKDEQEKKSMDPVRDLENVIFVNVKGNHTDIIGCGVIFGIVPDITDPNDGSLSKYFGVYSFVENHVKCGFIPSKNLIFVKPHEQFQFVENPLSTAVLTIGFTFPTEHLPDNCKTICVK